jgi:hypothetical protein
MRPAMPSRRPSSWANGLASLSGSDSTARISEASTPSCASSFATGLVEPLREDAHLGAVGQLHEPLAHVAQRVEGRQPGVDLVERVEDLLLLAVADLRGAHQHAAHAVERECRFIAHGAGSFLRAGERVHSE